MAVQKSAAAVTVRRVKGFNSVKSLLLLLVASNEIGAFQINSPTIRTPLAATAYSNLVSRRYVAAPPEKQHYLETEYPQIPRKQKNRCWPGHNRK